MFKKLSILILGCVMVAQVQAQDTSAFREQVQTMFVAYYGRPGDEGGINFWANELVGVNGNLSAIIDSFGNSVEFQSRFGDLDDETLVNNIFLQLLGRDADAGGLAFYVGELQAGRITLASMALDIANGAQNEDVDTIANKLEVANAFTEGYLVANVRYEGDQAAEDAKLLMNNVDATDASVTQALAELPVLLETFPAGGAIRVQVETLLGSFVMEMYSDEAPVTVANFLEYVDSDFYDDTIFHRLVQGFVLQGGGVVFEPENPTQFRLKETNDPIVNESDNGLSNTVLTVAMARTAEPDTATSQFYINLADNTGLDYQEGEPGYAVFAKVISGEDVVAQLVNAQQFTLSPPVAGVGSEVPVIQSENNLFVLYVYAIRRTP